MELSYATSMALTVPQAARRTGRHPETIRRWIREGKLRARKIGTQHLIEEKDLDVLLRADVLPGFSPLGRTIVTLLREDRREH